ncbi:hypothetical protein LguiA_006434 [Lonicera macranthoides]
MEKNCSSEAAGKPIRCKVESVGKHVEEVKGGDLVLPLFQRNCEECRDCKSKKSNICTIFPTETYIGMPRDGGSRFKDMNGEVLHHFLYVSSFAEYTVVDVTHVVKISHEIPLDKACLLSCGVTTGIGAVWKVAQVEEGSTVAIFGLGAVGLAVAEGARLHGASKIIGVDLNPHKVEIGKKFGVTDFINPSNCVEKSVSQGWGKTVILGVEMHGSEVSISPQDILRGRTVTGSMFGGIKPKSDIPILVKKYLDKELNLDEFVSHEVGFQDINKAFDLLLQGKSLRCIIWMDA